MVSNCYKNTADNVHWMQRKPLTTFSCPQYQINKTSTTLSSFFPYGSNTNNFALAIIITEIRIAPAKLKLNGLVTGKKGSTLKFENIYSKF